MRESVSSLQARGVLLVEDGNHGENRPLRHEFVSAGTAFIRAADMASGVVDFTKAERINPAADRRVRKGRGRAGDVLLSHKGTVGKVARIPQDAPAFVCSPQTTFYRSLDPKVLSQDFLFYFLRSPAFQMQLRSRQGETDMAPYVSLTAQRSLLIDLPSIEEQRRIAGVLGALDDLIEVNRKLIADLDLSARLVGRQLLNSREFDLTPMSTLSEISKGYSYKSSELVDGGKWLVNLKNIGRGGEFQARGYKPLSATVKSHQLIDNGTVVVAQTDLTQDREVIARPVRVRRGDVVGQLVASLDLVVVRPVSPHTEESIFAVLDQEAFRSHALGYCNGTTVLHMGARAVPDFLAPVLTSTEIEVLTSQVRPLRQAADALMQEVAELEATRDELLPLLMSGRVRVGDVAA